MQYSIGELITCQSGISLKYKSSIYAIYPKVGNFIHNNFHLQATYHVNERIVVVVPIHQAISFLVTVASSGAVTSLLADKLLEAAF